MKENKTEDAIKSYRRFQLENLCPVRGLYCSNLSPREIALIRKMLVQSELNNENSEHCDSLFLQKEKEKSTPGTGHDRNRKSLENNDQQIVIQIPRNLKVASIHIQFEQEKAPHRVCSLASEF